MYKSLRYTFFLFLIQALFFTSVLAQESADKTYLRAQNELVSFQSLLSSRGYEYEDYREARISSYHQSRNSGALYVYIQQVYQGMDVHDALTTVVYHKDNQIMPANPFKSHLSSRCVLPSEIISPEIALSHVIAYLAFPIQKTRQPIDKVGKWLYRINDRLMSREPVEITGVWIEDDERIKMAWRISIDSPYSADMWDVFVDASSGAIIQTINHTLYCEFPVVGQSLNDHVHKVVTAPDKPPFFSKLNHSDGAAYLVYPSPIESPIHGSQLLVTEPADTMASPFGWHDTDGLAGPEFTITRGNNVHAFQDSDDDGVSEDDEPNGGNALSFIFSHDRDRGTVQNVLADVTNLFYWNNYMHDWSYRFGFDEAAGNFQLNNYNRGGVEGDFIRAHSLDGGDLNNATFSSPTDGHNGRMQMYRWRVGINSLTITLPSSLSNDYAVGTAEFGPVLDQEIIGSLALVNDGDSILTDACSELINGQDLQGKIALIDRGSCFFVDKTANAEAQGATACIICNNVPDEGIFTMGAPANSPEVGIPAVILSKEDCDLIKAEMESGQDVLVRLNPIEELSSSFDNGVIAHEYAHGISGRLTGGAANSSCLNNDEQAGEGWSDFIALVLTHEIGDEGNDSRGIGNYLTGEGIFGSGIRRYPYSVDMNINPQTMSHIRRTSSPHAVGEVWAATLWDLYWLFVENYGFDQSWEDSLSGNFRTLQLVMDGLKLQPCNPGLLQARDAILEADNINYNGVHQCEIWEVFARRGMGIDAKGGSTQNRQDNVDGFSVPPNCIDGVKIDKIVPSSIEAGAVLEITITVRNDKKTPIQEVVVSDQILPATTVSAQSATHPFTLNEGEILFDLGTMLPGEEIAIQYTLETQSINPSEFMVYNNFEGSIGFDREETSANLRGWNLNTTDSEGGVFSMRVRGDTVQGEAFMTLQEPVLLTGDMPTLRFWHRYNTQTGIDGGFVELSTDNGRTWDALSRGEFLINPYPDYISRDFRYTDLMPAFTGERSWHESAIDLGRYKDEEVLIRFRFFLQEYNEVEPFEGWMIDNFEIFDRQELFGEACISYDQGVAMCDSGLTIINSMARTVSVFESEDVETRMLVLPNPFSSSVVVWHEADKAYDVTIQIWRNDGVRLKEIRRRATPGNQSWKLNMNSFPPGTYIISLQTPGGTEVVKITKS